MYGMIIYKTFLLYIFIIVVYRVMGKKEVGQLSIVDLIVTILIAELAAISIEQVKSSIFISIIPILVLVLMQIILSYLSLKSNRFRKFIDGNPSIIIHRGKVNFSLMTKLRYGLDDLLSQLREKGVKSLEDVDYAVLENSGNLSVFENEKDYPMPLIVDGEMNQETLEKIGKDEQWLNQVLKREKLTVKEVFYAFYTKNETYIIKKSDLL